MTMTLFALLIGLGIVTCLPDKSNKAPTVDFQPQDRDRDQKPFGCGSSKAIHLKPAQTIPQCIAPYVDPTFPAFACEERSLLFFAGPSGKPNLFSRNLIDEIAVRTGVKPILRVGGTSLDHSTYDASQLAAVEFPPGQAERNVPFGLTFGPSYFDSFANLPGVRYIFDIPLAERKMENALAFARAGLEKIGLENIEQFEVGNEPNFYAGGDRESGYGPREYVEEWKEWTDAVSRELVLPKEKAVFQAVTLASPRYPEVGEWNVQNLFRHGLENIKDRVKSYSIHYYQTTATAHSNLQRDLMNHTAITRGTHDLTSTIQHLNTKTPRIPLNVAEFGSALNPLTNNYTLESVLGAALWQVDFMLWCLSIGVNRAHVQLGIGFAFAPWQPTRYRGRPAKVNAPYYAHLFIADFIGVDTALQVVNVPLESDTLAAYAGYVLGALDRVAVVNLRAWSSGEGERGGEDVQVDVPAGCAYAEVWRLTAERGAGEGDTRGITLGGRRWTWESGGRGEVLEGVEGVRVVWARGGRVEVRLEDSEAVVVRFR